MKNWKNKRIPEYRRQIEAIYTHRHGMCFKGPQNIEDSDVVDVSDQSRLFYMA